MGTTLAGKELMGTTLAGKWRVEHLIGVGGTAAVYEAVHRNGRRAAVKILRDDVALSPVQRVRFTREGYVANQVGHPGVVQVYDDDVDERGRAFLVMELLSGRTLTDHAEARGGRLPAEEVIELAGKLLDVLAAAHEKGILHRDIKPDNLFLTTDGLLKVLDFGIARLADRQEGWCGTADGWLLGTPAFSPPEQARGRMGELDARSDLWAVGATIFTLLTGRFVHEADTPNEQLGKAMIADAPSLDTVMPGLPQALVQLVDRALAYERAERWSSAREMLAAVDWIQASWQELQSGSSRAPDEWAPAAGAATTLDGRTPPAAKVRKPLLLGVAALSLLAGVIVVPALLVTSAPRHRDISGPASPLNPAENPEPARASPAPMAVTFVTDAPSVAFETTRTSKVRSLRGAREMARALRSALDVSPSQDSPLPAELPAALPAPGIFDRRH